ncbi:unnamed protein product [Phytophthora lilii]|uniref:Unnamed protein product n=1 Tax=Phytophthora lilii TaxID=2077276 RepID=A0A9W6WUH9_9STRA|nr:unnamed protein product [Phytophthora lilii]
MTLLEPPVADAAKPEPRKPATKSDAKAKAKTKPKPKPPTNTLDRWFKRAPADKKPSDTPKEKEPEASKEQEKPVEKKKKKSSRNFVQRYIHITDECRVCEQVTTEEASRCELRCATCSMTVHQKCYGVKGELPDGDWNCRRCQFIYDGTAWEDISSLIGEAVPEGVTFPKCKPLDDKQYLHKLQTNCDFATVFLFLQRFRRLGLKLSNVVTTLEFDRNDALVEQIDGEEAESMDAATVPNAAVWVCRCANVGGSEWETVCNDLESVESLVEEFSLSVESADLQLWQALSRGALKKLTRQQEKRKRNERWKHELAVSGVLDPSGNFEGIGRRSLRNRQQVNYANIDAEVQEEEEDIVADSENSGDEEEEEAFEAKSEDDADSETDGDNDDDEDEDESRRSTRNGESKKRKSPHESTPPAPLSPPGTWRRARPPARDSDAACDAMKLSASVAASMQPTTLEPTPLSSENGPLQSAFGLVVHRGWLNLKTRSMVNVRPRHMRYCILTRDSLQLSTFKFQPSTGDLQSGLVKPLRTYKVLGVAPWDGRRFAFLVSVKQVDDHADKVLEIDGPTATAASDWIHHLRVLTSHDEEDWPPQPSLASLGGSDHSSDSPSDAATLFGNSKKEANLWVKGASVHRGLLNASGENNCFLNVVIQSFWHLTSMRHFLLHVEVKDESRTVESNVLRALKSMMMEYDDTSSGVLHSRAIRKGLSVLYAADKNFQEGAMYDAEETLLALLNLMHQQTEATEIEETHKTTMMVKSLVRVVSVDTYEEKPQAVFDDNSIPHLVFSHQIYDRYVCGSCNHSSPWDLYSNLVYSTYASDLYACKYESTEQMFRRLTAQEADIASKCEQEGCKGKLGKERVIHRFPMVFAVSILWATQSATKEQVQGVLDNIDDRLDLAKCFDAAGPVIRFKNGGLRTTYRLRGFVCYYGRHYVALFYSTAHKMWLLFDDSRVLEMGAWSNVVAECLKGRFQPVLLFYELPDQRKDSSVGIFVNDGSLNVERQKSLSVGSQQGEMMPPSIKEESPDIERPSLRRQDDAELRSVDEDSTLSSGRGTHTVTELETNPEIEMEELSLRDSITQNITPVSAAIAMCPRTISMNAPLGEDEYDVRFGEALLLGMYLEKIDNELCVTSFPRGAKGGMFGAEKCGQISLFDTILQANGHPLQHYQVDRALKMIKAQTRPLVIRFRKSKRVQQLLDMGFSRELAVEALQKKKGDVQAAANYCFEATG